MIYKFAFGVCVNANASARKAQKTRLSHVRFRLYAGASRTSVCAHARSQLGKKRLVRAIVARCALRNARY